MKLLNTTPKHKAKNFLLYLLLIGLLSSCGSGAVSNKSKVNFVPLENSEQIESEGNNYVIIFSPSSDKIPLNSYFTMDVQVNSSMNQSLRFPVELAVDAGMKAHNHGMNVQPIIESMGQGHFKIKGMLFHMPGKWFLRFKVNHGVMSDHAETNLLLRH